MNFSTRQALRARSPAPRETRQISLVEFEAALPEHLERFGTKVRACLCGRDGAPLVVVIGGISANRFPCIKADGSPGWWSGLAREYGGVDPRQFRILGFEFIADGKGRVAPSTTDQAEVIGVLLDTLGTRQAHAIVGASYGAMVALSFAQHFSECVDRMVVISSGAEPYPASTALRELQRRIVGLALEAGRGEEGLSIARGLAMMTYRTAQEFEERFNGGTPNEDVLSCSQAGAYLRARGDAYLSVMTPERFLSLSASIDRHEVVPEKIDVPVLLIGSDSDQLVPPAQMKALHQRIGGPAELHLLESFYGHDMFLKDTDQFCEVVGTFLRAGQ